MDPLEAFTAFEGRLLRRVSTRVAPFEWGTAFLDDNLPQRYYSNFLRTETDLIDVSAEDLIAAADQILGDDRYEHRLVIVRDEAAAERLAPGFAAAGFTREPEVVQLLRREPDRPGALDVDIVSFAEARELILQTHLEDEQLPDAIAAPFTDARAKYETAIGAQFFVAQVDGEQAGLCELYIDGEDAQVEDVGTILRFRNRGVARSVVLAACEAARAAGAIRIWILADDEDWPKQLYERLGFDRLATDVGFLRSPATTS
ncbi:MAG TPA: GNAT family N-acetyltransferase [Actinomycetota bacterium]|nr:GNAT family N-acetyltransferase [Actinomycetota bacterium]